MKAQERHTTIFEAVVIQNQHLKKENKRIKRALARLNKRR